MIRVTKILEIQKYYVDCELNNGVKKRIELEVLFKKHADLKGIDQLLDLQYLKTANIGDCGEIYWKDTITTSNNEKWNYDLSPEFINHYGSSI